MNMMQTADSKVVRLGFVGLGTRGVYHLKAALALPAVEVAAVCDLAEARVQQAAEAVTATRRPAPRLYSKGEKDYERMCAEEKLDAVICSTPAESHAAVCLAANRNGKHAVSEGPLALTLEDAWALIESYEKTKKWSALALEPTLAEAENGANLTLLNLVRNGLLGDMIHCEDGVLRDRRSARLSYGPADLALKYNANLAPDVPMNRLIPVMDINHGDRFDFLMSMSSRAAAMAEFGRAVPGNAAALTKNTAGDYNATIIHTLDGKLVTLNYDTSTPNPREYCRLQGTKGVYMSAPGLPGPMIYIDGVSKTPHTWEKVDKYFEQYRHPLLKTSAGTASGAPLTWQLLVKALREGRQPYFDVYDSVTSSAIIALTQKSVANRSRPVEFPDFTRGQWKNRRPMDLLNV